MSRKLVLCIDDRTTSAEVRKLLLECEGYRVLTASNCRSGITSFAKHSVDLVVLDYDLPDVNGTVLAAKMREFKPQVPIIILSGYTTPPAGVKRTVDAYIRKGEHPSALLDCVEELLRQT
jgi:DNA-binding response OmpR family regulator